MMVCPQCGKRYAPGTETCQVDGSRLSQLSEDPYLGYQIANFQLKQRIGRGGFGLVYLAEHVNLRNQVAIKLLRKQYTTDEQLVERFKREARVSSQIHHPNVVQISDFGYDDTIGFYYVMEYLDGKSLSEMMREYTRGMPLERLLPILKQICSALDAAHSNNVVHRDLKPSNIFLIEQFGQDDIVKVLDFGIAKVIQGEEGQGVTATGQIVGSPRFMSPEQARGRHSDVDPRSDIYALGVMLFWMLTGRLPFESKQLARLLFMHIKAPPPTLNSIRSALHFTPQLEAVIASALAKEKSARPPAAGELYRQVETACQTQTVPEAPLIDPFGADPEDRTVRVVHPSNPPPAEASLSVPSAMPDTPNSVHVLQQSTPSDQHTIDVPTRSLEQEAPWDDEDDEGHTQIDNVSHIHQMLDEQAMSPMMAFSSSPVPPPSLASPPPPAPPLPAPSLSSPLVPPLGERHDDEEATALRPSAPSFWRPPLPSSDDSGHDAPAASFSPLPHPVAPPPPAPPPPLQSSGSRVQRRATSRWKTILLVTLTLILLGELAFLGWRWWKRQQASTTPPSQSQLAPSSSATTPAPRRQPATPSSLRPQVDKSE